MFRVTCYSLLCSAVLVSFPQKIITEGIGIPASMIVQGGALVILGWTVWYLLAVGIPAMLKSAREEREEFLKIQEEARREFKDSLTILAGSLNVLTATLVASNRPSNKARAREIIPPDRQAE